MQSAKTRVAVQLTLILMCALAAGATTISIPSDLQDDIDDYYVDDVAMAARDDGKVALVWSRWEVRLDGQGGVDGLYLVCRMAIWNAMYSFWENTTTIYSDSYAGDPITIPSQYVADVDVDYPDDESSADPYVGIAYTWKVHSDIDENTAARFKVVSFNPGDTVTTHASENGTYLTYYNNPHVSVSVSEESDSIVESIIYARFRRLQESAIPLTPTFDEKVWQSYGRGTPALKLTLTGSTSGQVTDVDTDVRDDVAVYNLAYEESSGSWRVKSYATDGTNDYGVTDLSSLSSGDRSEVLAGPEITYTPITYRIRTAVEYINGSLNPAIQVKGWLGMWYNISTTNTSERCQLGNITDDTGNTLRRCWVREWWNNMSYQYDVEVDGTARVTDVDSDYRPTLDYCGWPYNNTGWILYMDDDGTLELERYQQ